MRQIILLLFFQASIQLFAQDSLVHDPTFGNSGYANVSLTPINTTPSWHPSNQNEYYISALQRTDGKIVLVSHFRNYSGDTTTLVVRLINSNGTTDNTFNGSAGFQSIVLALGVSDYASALITNDDAILFMPGQRVYRLDPTNNYALDANFNNGNGYYQFSSGFGTGINHMNYFPEENVVSLSGKMGSQFVAEARVIDATTGTIVGQVDTQDWDFNPFNGTVNSTDCLVKDTLMYQLGSAKINPNNSEYIFYVHIHSFSNLFDTLIPLTQIPGSFANQTIHGTFLNDNSLLLSFFNFTFGGSPGQIKTMHLSSDGMFDSNYGLQIIDTMDNETYDAYFTKDFSNDIYLYTDFSDLRRVYKFNKTNGYLDQSFCGDGVANLTSTSGYKQTNVFALNDQSILVINTAPYQGGVNPINANSLMKYIDFGTNSISSNEMNTISLYPNPTNASLTIENALNANIRIYDNTCKEVKTINNNQALQVIVAELVNGLYFIALEKDGMVQTARFIIE